MRGTDQPQSTMFSYVSPEARIPDDHPLRATREIANRALGRLDRKFRSLYSRTGRPSVPPEQLLRALLLQVLFFATPIVYPSHYNLKDCPQCERDDGNGGVGHHTNTSHSTKAVAIPATNPLKWSLLIIVF